MKRYAYLVAYLAISIGVCLAVKLKNHNYEEMLECMEKVHEKCPDITHRYDLTGHPNVTPQGRKLAVLVFSDNPKYHEIGK